MRGYPFWPTKVLDVDADSKIVTMLCFEDNIRYYNIPLDELEIKIYSSKAPCKTPSAKHHYWATAVQVLKYNHQLFGINTNTFN